MSWVLRFLDKECLRVQAQSMFRRAVRAVVPSWVQETVNPPTVAAGDVLKLARRSFGRARWVAAEARAVMTEVRDLLERRYGDQPVEPEWVEPTVQIQEVKRPPTQAEVRAWLSALRMTQGSRDSAVIQSGAESILQLSDLQELSSEARKALEETVTVPGYAPEVQLAAVDALGWNGSVGSDRALRRMRAVVKRRMGWERRAGDETLLRRIEGQLAAAPRRLSAQYAPAA